MRCSAGNHQGWALIMMVFSPRRAGRAESVFFLLAAFQQDVGIWPAAARGDAGAGLPRLSSAFCFTGAGSASTSACSSNGPIVHSCWWRPGWRPGPRLPQAGLWNHFRTWRLT